MEMSEKIWYEDLSGFITIDNYFVVFPTSNMTFNQKVNALVRLFIYVGLIFAILTSNPKYMFFGIIAAVVSVIMIEFDTYQKKKIDTFLEKKDLAVMDGAICARSTVDNPFMNPSVVDIAYNPTRPAACNVTNASVQQQIENNFNKRLFKDTGDLFGKMASQREFYTVPSTTIPNNQIGFAEWCYGSGATCKEGNGFACSRNKEVNFPHLRAGATATP